MGENKGMGWGRCRGVVRKHVQLSSFKFKMFVTIFMV